MLSKMFKYLKKLVADRTFKRSVLHFAAFFVVLSTFAVLTQQRILTTSPAPSLPNEYKIGLAFGGPTMTPVELEHSLRAHAPNVQGLVFFKGLNTVVVLGNGFEHDFVVGPVDVDEMRKLALAGGLPVTDKAAAASDGLYDSLNGWWWWSAIFMGCWLFWLLFFKRNKGETHSRFTVFYDGVATLPGRLHKLSGLKPTRYYPMLTGLFALLAVAGFVLPCFHSDGTYSLTPEYSTVPRVQSWQIARHLANHPGEFQRVSAIDELNAAYIMLNSSTVTPVVLGTGVGSDPNAATGANIDAYDERVDAAQAQAQPMSQAEVQARMQEQARAQMQAVLKARAAASQSTVVVGKDGKPMTMVARTVVFAPTAAGRAEYLAFVAAVQAANIEFKRVPAIHEDGMISTETYPGVLLFIAAMLATFATACYTWKMWHDWNHPEEPSQPAEIFTPLALTAGGGILNAGTAVVTRKEDRKTFADVAGCQEAIDELKVVKKKIMRPRLYKVFGAPVPAGVILWGPPGTGKTLLARALAGEVGGSFQVLSGSEFVEMYVGVGAKRVREAYAKARLEAKRTGRISIIFVDEFDALARKRSTSGEGGNREYEQTLNQLLVEMNGFGNHGMVLTMAATNRLDILDEAVLRPGRFDIKVKVPKPDRKGRGQIYKIYLKKLKLVLDGITEEQKQVSFEKLVDELARRSHDFSGAEIEGSVTDGATIAVERQFGEVTEDITEEQVEEYRKLAIITASDLHLGIDKMAYGTQIRSRVRTDAERWATSVHEIAHAAVPTEEKADKVNRITIVMTDKSLGLMDSAPDEGERYDWTDVQFMTRLRTMLAGRAAEKVILAKISTGASNDFERASLLARQMVGVFGMSKQFGNKSIPLDQHGFPASHIGEAMLGRFNDAWGAIIDETQAQVEAFVEKHREQIEHCAQKLYDDETLSGDDFRALWAEKGPAEKSAEVGGEQ